MPLVQGSSSHAEPFPGEDQGEVAGGEGSVAGVTMQALGTYGGDNVFKNWPVPANLYAVLRREEAGLQRRSSGQRCV